jgi:hypothetical protein
VDIGWLKFFKVVIAPICVCAITVALIYIEMEEGIFSMYSFVSGVGCTVLAIIAWVSIKEAPKKKK